MGHAALRSSPHRPSSGRPDPTPTLWARAALLVMLLAAVPACSAVSETTSPAGCDVPASWGVPEQIGALWRCELATAGVPPAEAAQLAAEAVVLAHCESAWNPSALAYAGQFRTVPHPVTGREHTEAGVFQLSAIDAELFVPGGPPALTDSRANIVGAARLFLSRYLGGGRLAGFSPWACAPRVIPGFPGAPDRLPDWAFAY
jgi:hypothetical protein